VPENLPTIRIPAGLDEPVLRVVDDTNVIAETTWRPSGNYRPDPATWDWALHRLGYDPPVAVAARAARVRLRGRAHR
jgi:hypothetical protein